MDPFMKKSQVVQTHHI